MPGPLPKNQATRQRRNTKSTRAELETTEKRMVRAPALPRHPDNEAWHEQAKFFWAVVWRSPMVSQYVEADLPGLIRMLVLTDRFFKSPSVVTSGELRQLSMSYGLSPIDRRRLEWTIVRAEEAAEDLEHKRARRGRVVRDGRDDPRDALEK